MLDETDIVAFGYLPFDVYDKWDPNSSFAKTQQFRALVHSWVRLGRKGRNVTLKYTDGDYLSSEEIPHYMSQDFMTVEERAKDGQSGKVIWIRTWYGQKNDPASQTAANAGYDRLRSILEYNDLFD